MAEKIAIPSSVAEDNKASSHGSGTPRASALPAPAERRRSDKGPRMVRGVSSLTVLIDAYKEKDRNPDQWESAQARFEEANGKILDSYFANNIRAGAVLVKTNASKTWRWRERRRLFVCVDKSDILSGASGFDHVIWRTIWTARQTEREADYVLSHRTRKVFANMLHQVAVYLVETIDALHTIMDDGKDVTTAALERAAKTATAELSKLEQYVEHAAIRAAIRLYLFGLPLGVAALAAIIFIANHTNIPSGEELSFGTITVVAGGVGSIASVMFRLTRGQRLSVDTQQGPAVTVFAGLFRPLIGAVFGAALYVLVKGGLLPLHAAPPVPEKDFFAGLAFIAGFSERWAQDTIVRSAPITPSPATSANKANVYHDGKFSGDDPDRDNLRRP
jgi:hypothetical protein